MGTAKLKTIGILALPGVQLLDVCGAMDVFAEANSQAGEQVYDLKVISTQKGPIVSSSGVRLVYDRLLEEMPVGTIDTLLVAGCPHISFESLGEPLIAWLRSSASKSRRFGSICSGALVLAKAKLIDGKRVTTHWAVADKLQATFPKVIVEPDAIHVRDGKVRTSGGVTAGMDLAIALVEEDLGRDIAKSVANQLVMFFKRSGGQLQFSQRGDMKAVGRSALQELQRYAAANLSQDLSVSSLASRMELSERHFSRLFRTEVGVTPAEWIEIVRIDAARRLLENGSTPKQVAATCGFADADTLRRAFFRRVNVTPTIYRRNFFSSDSRSF
jgi:transcriptional regulator GlxA family with amidase domain